MRRRFREMVVMGLLSLMANAVACQNTKHSSDTAYSARHVAAHLLRRGDLIVEVMDPSAPDRYNRGVRFTPVAAVLRVQVDGHEFLFDPVDHDAVQDHGGLAAEFDLVTPDERDALMPPGYSEAKIGEGFVKVGVGVLAREAQAYSLFQQPRLLIPAVTTATWEADRALFRQSCTGPAGVAYLLSARITLQVDQVVIDWWLQNTGDRAWTTRQYVHNFFCFDAHPVGPGYELSFPYDYAATGLSPDQIQARRTILFRRAIPSWVNLVVSAPKGYAGPNTCTLEHHESGLSVVCETSMPGLRTAVHARAAYVAPEQFIELKLAPGKNVTWRRVYTFSVKPTKPALRPESGAP